MKFMNALKHVLDALLTFSTKRPKAEVDYMVEQAKKAAKKKKDKKK